MTTFTKVVHPLLLFISQLKEDPALAAHFDNFMKSILCLLWKVGLFLVTFYNSAKGLSCVTVPLVLGKNTCLLGLVETIQYTIYSHLQDPLFYEKSFWVKTSLKM